MENQSVRDNEIRKTFETALNEHGYGFQYSVLKRIETLWGKTSGWLPDVSEFPVAIGAGTRVDFILRRYKTIEQGYTANEKNLVLILAECKRANPAYANWWFVKAPHTFRGAPQEEFLQIEKVTNHGHIPSIGDRVSSTAIRPRLINNAYHIGLEVKMPGAKGDVTTGKSGSGAIEDAASQICRGLNCNRRDLI